MNAHIIPGRSCLRITIPACTNISMGTGKYSQHIGILFKRFVMICVFHYMPAKVQAPFFLLYKTGYLSCYGFTISRTSTDKSERMRFYKFQDLLLILLGKI